MSSENIRKIVELTTKDESGKEVIVFPQTHLSAVINSNQESLDKILKDIQAGNIDFTGIEDKIKELHDKVFPVTSSLTLSGNKTIIEYTGQSQTESFEYTISIPDYEENGDEKDPKDKIDTLDLKFKEPYGITDYTNDLNKKSEKINFNLHVPNNFTGKSDYEVTLIAKLDDGRKTSSVCRFSQIAPSWVGWAPYDNARDLINNLGSEEGMIKLLETDLSGDYSWDSIKEKTAFWIIVPQSPDFKGYSVVTGNGFQIVMSNKENNEEKEMIYNINNISYLCFRNNSGPLQRDLPSRYKITLSN